MRRSGVYTVMDVPEKLFVDKGMWYCGFSDKEQLSKVLFTIVYKDGKTGYPCIKRCRVEGFILNRDYMLVPDDAKVLYIGTKEKFSFTVKYVPKARLKTLEQTFKAQDYAEKGLKTLGVRLAPREAKSVVLEETSSTGGGLRKAAAKALEEKSVPAKTSTAKAVSAKGTKSAPSKVIKKSPAKPSPKGSKK